MGDHNRDAGPVPSFSGHPRRMTEPTPTQGKHPGSRPTKLAEGLLAALTGVLDDGDNALIYTGEELIFMINDRLPVEGRIGGETPRRWKNGGFTDDVRGQKFCGLHKRAPMRQK